MFKLAKYSISIILLAAGRGTRLRARGVPKLLLPMRDGKPIIAHAAKNALGLQPLEMIVVIRPDLPELSTALSDLTAHVDSPIKCVSNPRYAEGMGTSLAAGVAALSPQTQAALVMLGDEPDVSPDIVHRLVSAHLQHNRPITVPIYGDQAGPPTLFSHELFPDLTHLEGDAGGRQLIALYPDKVCRVPFPPTSRPRDVDTPEDYQALL